MTDYDDQFVYKLNKWKPVYEIERVLDHHCKFYLSDNPQGRDAFLKHMRYVILPMMKKRKNSEACIELFEEWLSTKAPKKETNRSQTVKNTIKIGNVNAPLQFQQNSDNSVQTQHNHYQNDQIKELFELVNKDIASVNSQIRSDFAMEMNYAITQLERNKDIKPQLRNIGGLIKDVGMNTFANLLAAPIFEVLKPLLGL